VINTRNNNMMLWGLLILMLCFMLIKIYELFVHYFLNSMDGGKMLSEPQEESPLPPLGMVFPWRQSRALLYWCINNFHRHKTKYWPFSKEKKYLPGGVLMKTTYEFLKVHITLLQEKNDNFVLYILICIATVIK
jgi:hypothetical protein